MSVRSFMSQSRPQSRPRSRAGSVSRSQSRHGSNTKAGLLAGFTGQKTNVSAGSNIRPDTWVNCPMHKKHEGDFFDPCTLKAISTRRHVTGNSYQLPTRQYPADREFQIVEYELPGKDQEGNPEKEVHPADEIKLRGGHGEPVYFADCAENSLAEVGCICPGFQLVSIKYLNEDGLQVSLTPAEDVEFTKDPDEKNPTYGIYKDKDPNEILKGLPLPITLCCLSPLAKLPSFSEREIAQKLGIRKIKEVHLRRLTDALQLRWLEVTIGTRADLSKLDEILDDKMVFKEDMTIFGGRGMDREGKKVDAILEPGYILKPVTASGTKISKDKLTRLKPPLKLYVGQPRTPKAIENVPFSSSIRLLRKLAFIGSMKTSADCCGRP